MKVLIIEDNPSNMKVFSEMLSIAGYKVSEAFNAETGIRMAREELPGVIIMDIQMPGMDGIAAIKHLKSDQSTRNIKVLAATARAMRDEEKEIKSAGFDDYISKPVSYKEFIGKVKGLGSSITMN